MDDNTVNAPVEETPVVTEETPIVVEETPVVIETPLPAEEPAPVVVETPVVEAPVNVSSAPQAKPWAGNHRVGMAS
jgi:hypothetical protein